MTKDEFLGRYWSKGIPWVNGQTAYVRGHSPWVQGLFNSDTHDLCLWHLELESKYDRRWHWWSVRIPPPLWTMVFVGEEYPNPKFVDRLLGRALAFYALWRAL